MTVAALGPARPLRALGVLLGLWVAGRTAFAWWDVSVAQLAVGAPAERQLTRAIRPVLPSQVERAMGPAGAARQSYSVALARLPVKTAPPGSVATGTSAPRLPPVQSVPFSPQTTRADIELSVADYVRIAPPARTQVADGGSAVVASLWSGSIWLAARGGTGTAFAAGNGQSAGQLGGSQMGARVYRRLTPALSLTGRVSAALSTPQTEASAGLALRHGRLALLAERRFALDRGGRNDWSLTAVGGVSDVSLPLKFRLDGYAQAGIVGRDGFADGALRVERPVAADGANRLSVGAGAWGSIQPGAARLDVGPQIVGRTVVGGYPVRVSAEWRQRVAGNAAPNSGPVVTLGADF